MGKRGEKVTDDEDCVMGGMEEEGGGKVKDDEDEVEEIVEDGVGGEEVEVGRRWRRDCRVE